MLHLPRILITTQLVSIRRLSTRSTRPLFETQGHAMSSQPIDVSSIPTTEISIERLKDLSKDAFLKVKSRCPTIEWAGVFGSVSRGTQRPDSDIDLIIGHASDADYFSDVGGSMGELQEVMPEALGRDVDIVHVVRGKPLGYVQMEALLSCKTVWGDPSWPTESKTESERLLRDGYLHISQATALFKEIKGELPSQQEFILPENHDLRQATLTKLLHVIELVQFKNDHPFSGTSEQLLSWLFSQKSTIQECLQSDFIDRNGDKLVDIWSAVSDQVNGISFRAIEEMAEQSFRRGGLMVPTSSDVAVPG